MRPPPKGSNCESLARDTKGSPCFPSVQDVTGLIAGPDRAGWRGRDAGIGPRGGRARHQKTLIPSQPSGWPVSGARDGLSDRLADIEGAGLPAQFPRLAGQWAEYTENQLKTFRSGERGNDPEKMMRTIAAKMSDQEIKAVAEYAAGLR